MARQQRFPTFTESCLWKSEKLLPPEIAKTDQAKRLKAFGCVTEMDIVRGRKERPSDDQGQAPKSRREFGICLPRGWER